MTLEDLGYKRVGKIEHWGSFFRVRYEKDTTIYYWEGQKIPKDKLEYCHDTIFIYRDGASCWSSRTMESTSLSFEEMEAILEMRKNGEFSKFEQGEEKW